MFWKLVEKIVLGNKVVSFWEVKVFRGLINGIWSDKKKIGFICEKEVDK